MSNYEFKLTPAYCLYNGVAVMEQKGASISFLTEHIEDEILKERLKKAFRNYLEYVNRQNDCEEEFKRIPKVEFIGGDRQLLRKYVSKIYETNLFLEEESKSEIDKQNENEAAAVILLDTILNEARTKNATDIHIENNEVRFRVNGVLENEFNLDKERIIEVIQRVKYLAGMNVLEKRRSQDGHFVYGSNDPLFVRVSTMGIIGNGLDFTSESVVIRLLDTKRVPLTLNLLGFNENQFGKIEELCAEKNGLIVICGPTGAGKSTTAASMLLEIEKRNSGRVKIISMEDPPEYVIPGVTQIQIDETMKNSYTDALVHVFRQDPDVLMIGEIRNEKSASAAVRAAITGHLVIATVHTANAAGVVLRLEDLGISRNLIGAVLRGVVVQEMNHVANNVNLLADVSLPVRDFQDILKEDLSENELDMCFEHFTNYPDVVRKGIMQLGDMHSNKNNRLLILKNGLEKGSKEA